MPLETGTTIAQLQNIWPLSGDPILEGDDHIRLIKSVLKAQFPGDIGDGFTKPILSTEDELNFCQGLTGNIQFQIDQILNGGTLPAPTGTVMLFRQAAPPAGWVAQTDVTDHMLRAVNPGSVGIGGTDSPLTFSATHYHTTSNTTLTIDQIPAHSHTIPSRSNNNGGPGYAEDADSTGTAYTVESSSSGGGNAHNHGNTSTFTAEFAPLYVDVIIAVKS